MEKVSIVGVDISKRVFQLHGSTASGRPVFVKKLSRSGFLPFLEDLPPCLVVMEACGGAHHWGRQIIAKGHECRLIPPVYVKPFVKRQKSDANDAAAIVEAAQRPTMRFVAVKPEAAQADAMLFRTRALFVRQRTQTVNALRGHLAEFGLVSARGVANVEALRSELEKAAEGVPELVRQSAEMLFAQIDALSGRIAELDRGLKRRSREREDIRNLMTIPGIGPVCAMAAQAFAPPMEHPCFESSPDSAFSGGFRRSCSGFSTSPSTGGRHAGMTRQSGRGVAAGAPDSFLTRRGPRDTARAGVSRRRPRSGPPTCAGRAAGRSRSRSASA